VLARSGLALAVVLMLGYVLTAWSRGDLLALGATAGLAILPGHRRWQAALSWYNRAAHGYI